jgi:hypothetical protein
MLMFGALLLITVAFSLCFPVAAIRLLFTNRIAKFIFVRAMFAGTAFIADPLFNEIDASNLESVRKNVVFDNFFVDTPFQAVLRRKGVADPFLGGSAMRENFRYGRVQGAAVAPGSTVTVTRQQVTSGMKFFPKAYVSWTPIDDWELDDGSGTGGVINSGPARIYDMYEELIQNMTSTINTMLEMDSFRHGQTSGTGISDNRQLNSNGLDEALNNGIDPSPFGNIYSTYGGQTRNANVGIALNSTPIWLGVTAAGATAAAPATNGTGQIDFNALMKGWAQGRVTGGEVDLGITNVFGFAAIANALDSQRRDVSNSRHDIKWDSLKFNSLDIYDDPLAPSAVAANYISLAPAAGAAGNTTLVDGAGTSTVTGTITTPQYTSGGLNVSTAPTGSGFPSNATCTVGEVLYMLTAKDFKLRPTNKSGWNFGLRRAPFPNNVSIDALFERLGTNLYNPMPRHSVVLLGFSS